MKRILCSLVFGACGLATAGPLEDADKLLMAKAYDKAFPMYARLADAGNTEAQFRLGEMYWYGDGTAPDLKLATAWLQKAAARGHAGAIESLAVMKQRETRSDDIAFWTSRYQGEDLVSGRFACTPPVIPALSVTAEEIKATADAYAAWQACYNGFAANINSSIPRGKRIPVELARLMTPREAEQARAHLNAVYDKIIARAQQDVISISSRYAMWESSTERQVLAENQARRLEYDILKRRLEERETQYFPRQKRVAPPIPPMGGTPRAAPVAPPGPVAGGKS